MVKREARLAHTPDPMGQEYDVHLVSEARDQGRDRVGWLRMMLDALRDEVSRLHERR